MAAVEHTVITIFSTVAVDLTIYVMSEQMFSARAVSRPNLRPIQFLIQKVSEFPLRSSGRSVKMTNYPVSEDMPTPKVRLDNFIFIYATCIRRKNGYICQNTSDLRNLCTSSGWQFEMTTWLTDLLQGNVAGSKSLYFGVIIMSKSLINVKDNA